MSTFCRSERCRGGSCIYVRETLESEELSKVTALSIEGVCEISAIYLLSFNTVVTAFYRSPSGNDFEFLDKLHEVFECLHGLNSYIVVAADVNVNFSFSSIVISVLLNLIVHFSSFLM